MSFRVSVTCAFIFLAAATSFTAAAQSRAAKPSPPAGTSTKVASSPSPTATPAVAPADDGAVSATLAPPALVIPPSPLTLPENPAALLGMDMEESLRRVGLAPSMTTLRGDEAWQDDIVSVWPQGYSLYWFQDRVWQIRVARPYRGSVNGLFLGDPVEKAVSLQGNPYSVVGDNYLFNCASRGYPVRMRIVARDQRISEIYVYRADF